MDSDVNKLVQSENSVQSLPHIPKDRNSIKLFPVDLKLDGTAILFQNSSHSPSSIPRCVTVMNEERVPAKDSELIDTSGIRALLQIVDLRNGPDSAESLHAMMADDRIIPFEGNVPADKLEASKRVESAILGNILVHCKAERQIAKSYFDSTRVPFQKMFEKEEAKGCRYIVQNKRSILQVFYRIYREKEVHTRNYRGKQWRVYIIRAFTPKEVNHGLIELLHKWDVYSALPRTEICSSQTLTIPGRSDSDLPRSPLSPINHSDASRLSHRYKPYNRPEAKQQFKTKDKADEEKTKISNRPAGLLLLAQTAIDGEPSVDDSQMSDPQWG